MLSKQTETGKPHIEASLEHTERLREAERMLDLASNKNDGYYLRRSVIQRIAYPQVDDQAEFGKLIVLMNE